MLHPSPAAWLWPLLATILLGGCARALDPMLRSPEIGTCGAEQDCLTRGEERFRAYRKEKLEEIGRSNGGYRAPSAPIARTHSVRTEYSVLLVHGLNDSAYYMAEIADVLYAHGFNVVTVLLPGHGTDTRDMIDVSAEQWRAEVDRGFEMANLVGRRVIVGGFSLGGALSIDAALRRSDVYGLLLFSPAIRLRAYHAVSEFTCIPGVRSYAVETDLPPNPVKYKHRVGNGVCQLSRLLKHNLAYGEAKDGGGAAFSEKVRTIGKRIRVATFLAITHADARISPAAVLALADEIDAPVVVTTFGRADNDPVFVLSNGGKVVKINDANLAHSFLVRRSNAFNGQENPYFDSMAEVMLTFLSDHFHPRREYSAREPQVLGISK